jgi:hypothetical protein
MPFLEADQERDADSTPFEAGLRILLQRFSVDMSRLGLQANNLSI